MRRTICILWMALWAIATMSGANPHVGNIYYHFYGDGTAVVTSKYEHDTYYNYQRNITKAVIPDTVYKESDTTKTNPYLVIAIDEYAFRDCSMLDSVIIPWSVTEIGANAFRGCTDLS